MTGLATKYDKDKIQYSLIPPECLEELAKLYTTGANKYGKDNWKKGFADGQLESALMRHFEAYRKGESRDKQDGQLHLTSVAWCAFTLMWLDSKHSDDDSIKKGIYKG